MFALFLKGLFMGFAIAAPVGPIGVLCIKRSLHNGFKIGLTTGLGAALAHGTYGFIAGFGLTAVSNLLVTHRNWIRLIGGIFLFYLGLKTLFSPPREKSTPGKLDKSPWRALVTTYFLALTNPMTILSFIAIFAGLGLGSENTHYASALLLVLGVVLGSSLWWLLLSSSVALILRQRMTPTTLRIINVLSGIIILFFGIYALKG